MCIASPEAGRRGRKSDHRAGGTGGHPQGLGVDLRSKKQDKADGRAVRTTEGRASHARANTVPGCAVSTTESAKERGGNGHMGMRFAFVPRLCLKNTGMIPDMVRTST